MVQTLADLERPLSRGLMDRASLARIPLSGTFELTPMCNFSCRMCYIRQTSEQVRAHDRPQRTLEQWLRTAEEAREMGMLYLLITGGEPLTWPDFWPLYEALSRMGFVISINTNGSMIDGEAAKRFAKIPPQRLNITLYGAGNDTYSRLCAASRGFDRVDRALTLLREQDVPVKLNCSLTPDNAADLEAMVAYAKDRGLPLSVTTYMFPPVRRDPEGREPEARFSPEDAARYHLLAYRLQSGERAYLAYLDRLVRGVVEPLGLDESCVDPLDGKVRCRAGSAAFWISWDGWLTACGMMPEPRADLNGTDFSKAWSRVTEQAQALRLSGLCRDCFNRGLCHTCAAAALAETGSAAGVPQYLCRMVRHMRRLAEAELGAACPG